jgi:hypothetical protein
MRRRKHIVAGVASFVLVGCQAIDAVKFETWDVSSGVVRVPAELTYHGIPLHSGSPQSLFLSLMIADSYPWVHTAILAIEDGAPWIYESQGDIQPTLRGPPNRNMGGGVRRVALDTFIRRQRFVGIFEPPSQVDTARVAAYARERYLARTPFDAYFDLADSSKVYCSEFTMLALTAGGAPPRRLSTFSANRSVRVVTDWLDIKPKQIIAAGAVVADARRVALISARHTEAQVQAYFDMKNELHNRFTPDQKLGNVLSFSPITMLAFRPEVRRYVNEVNAEARQWDSLSANAMRDRVRALAIDAFGPYEKPLTAALRSHIAAAKDSATPGPSALLAPASAP